MSELPTYLVFASAAKHTMDAAVHLKKVGRREDAALKRRAAWEHLAAARFAKIRAFAA